MACKQRLRPRGCCDGGGSQQQREKTKKKQKYTRSGTGCQIRLQASQNKTNPCMLHGAPVFVSTTNNNNNNNHHHHHHDDDDDDHNNNNNNNNKKKKNNNNNNNDDNNNNNRKKRLYLQPCWGERQLLIFLASFQSTLVTCPRDQGLKFLKWTFLKVRSVIHKR